MCQGLLVHSVCLPRPSPTASLSGRKQKQLPGYLPGQYFSALCRLCIYFLNIHFAAVFNNNNRVIIIGTPVWVPLLHSV
jgi:hypothetical protein